MPVQKFRTFDDARRSQRSEPGSAENLRRLAFVLDFWSRARKRKVPHGVFKFRSPEEADAARLEA
jgi:hypothetical protein